MTIPWCECRNDGWVPVKLMAGEAYKRNDRVKHGGGGKLDGKYTQHVMRQQMSSNKAAILTPPGATMSYITPVYVSSVNPPQGSAFVESFGHPAGNRLACGHR